MKTTWNYINKIVLSLTKFNLVMAIIALIAMTILVFIEIVSRSLLDKSTLIADEMTGYFNVAILFLGLSFTFKSNGLIKITILYDRFSARWKSIADIISMTIAIAFTLVLLVYIWATFYQSFIGKATSVFISRTPLYIPQFVMVIGIVFFVLQILILYVEKIKKSIRGKE
ncbi:TRAP transporter small permease subunit [Bacillus sp. M6-12]|uniref:TRAP transporter small permease subunit n=1 Tax=Bacillus sp. M6-12 TaxID=2054166 RepID=UPI0015E138FE|nr:TRAP transporter small permease [Bacillus sp. M6-12]